MASQRERIRIVEHLYGKGDFECGACKVNKPNKQTVTSEMVPEDVVRRGEPVPRPVYGGTITGRISCKVPPVVKLGQGDYESSLNPDPSFPSWFTFSNLLKVCFIVGAALFIVWAIRLP